MSRRPRSPYAPRYWPTWTALGLLWCLARLPYRWAMAAGDLIGLIAMPLARYRRHVVDTNLALCFPEKSPRERARLRRANFRYTGRGVVELGMAAWWPEERVAGIGTVTGLEHVREARRQGRGVILMGLHFTSLDFTGRIMLRHVPFQVIYRENENPVVERFMRGSRERHFEDAIHRRDMRGLIRALRRGQVIWYPPDQDYGRRYSVFAPLFGRPAATITVLSRLAAMTGAAVLPALNRARTDGRGYLVRIDPPLEGFPSGDEVADATRINRLLEERIREAPEQYYWVHRRFKTRPEGEPSPYRRKRRRQRSSP